jgi:hypothetical protein
MLEFISEKDIDIAVRLYKRNRSVKLAKSFECSTIYLNNLDNSSVILVCSLPVDSYNNATIKLNKEKLKNTMQNLINTGECMYIVDDDDAKPINLVELLPREEQPIRITSGSTIKFFYRPGSKIHTEGLDLLLAE